MKLHHLAIALGFLFTGSAFAQSGANGPAPSFTPSVSSSSSANFQQELEKDNFIRLSPANQAFRDELISCLPESQTEPSSFEEAEEQRLLSQQAVLSKKIRFVSEMIEELKTESAEEGMQELYDREIVLDQATLALLETQLTAVNEELAHYSHQTGSWEALIMESETDAEPIQWLVQAESGQIR